MVSIIIPTYNRCHHLGATLDSVMVQTYQNWECLVVDDGSLDYTEELMEFYCHKDERIKFFSRPTDSPKGANSCRNHGFKVSKGRFINWLDSDDLISPDKIKSQIEILKGRSDFSIATCPWTFFLNKNGILRKGGNKLVYQSYNCITEFLNDLGASGGFFPSHAYLMSRELVESAGDWLLNLNINQDGEFFARVFTRAREVLFCKGATVYYRQDEESSVSKLDEVDKVEQAVQSWILIESLFLLRFGEKTRLVSNSKNYLFAKINDRFPELLPKFDLFFKETRKETFLKRTWKIISTKLK